MVRFSEIRQFPDVLVLKEFPYRLSPLRKIAEFLVEWKEPTDYRVATNQDTWTLSAYRPTSPATTIR